MVDVGSEREVLGEVGPIGERAGQREGGAGAAGGPGAVNDSAAPVENAEALGQRSTCCERGAVGVEHDVERRQAERNSDAPEYAAQQRAAIQSLRNHAVITLGFAHEISS